MNFTPEQIIEAECQRLTAAFFLFIDNDRCDEVGSLLARDAVLAGSDGTGVQGREAIVVRVADRPAGLKAVHHISPAFIEVTSETEAKGLLSNTVFVNDGSGQWTTAPKRVCFWDSRYRIEDGRWRIAELRLRDIVGPT